MKIQIIYKGWENNVSVIISGRYSTYNLDVQHFNEPKELKHYLTEIGLIEEKK